MEQPIASGSLELLWFDLGPSDFETLCLELATVELGTKFSLYGRSGDKQFGIDLIGCGPTDDQNIAVQCRRVKRFGPSDLTALIDELATLPLQLQTLYVFVGCRVSSEVRNVAISRRYKLSSGAGPIQRLEVWDADDLRRRLMKYPNLVGAFFGLARRDALFPELKQADIVLGLESLRHEIRELRERLAPQAPIPAETNVNHEQGGSVDQFDLEVELDWTVSGMFPKADGVVEMHGAFPSRRGFSITQNLILTDKNPPDTLYGAAPRSCSLSIVLSPDETVEFETAMLIAKTSRMSDSYPVYYSHSVFVSGMPGSGPKISLPKREIAFTIYSWDHAWTAFAAAGRYLDRYEDAALAARRLRLQSNVADEVKQTRALSHQFIYKD